MDRQICRKINGWIERWMDGKKDGWMERWKDGWMEMDRWMER